MWVSKFLCKAPNEYIGLNQERRKQVKVAKVPAFRSTFLPKNGNRKKIYFLMAKTVFENLKLALSRHRQSTAKHLEYFHATFVSSNIKF